jgi:hypothetical protein
MASAELSRRVGRVVGYPPLSEMDDRQRREFQEALLDADNFEDLPGKWQAAILKAEENRPKLRVVSGAESAAGWRTGPAQGRSYQAIAAARHEDVSVESHGRGE